jgi:hypothetical protein
VKCRFYVGGVYVRRAQECVTHVWKRVGGDGRSIRLTIVGVNGIEAKAGVLEKRFEQVRTFSQPIKFGRYSFTQTADQSVNQTLEGQDEARCCSVRV